jgi:hypothetical protein
MEIPSNFGGYTKKSERPGLPVASEGNPERRTLNL